LFAPPLFFFSNNNNDKGCLLNSPLLVSTDIREPYMTEEKKAILLNAEVIAVNQDPLGKQGERIALYDCPNGSNGNLTCQIWAKPLAVSVP
jgi:hypothetical protein